MTTEQIIGLCMAIALMGVGVLGSLIPVIPGAPVIVIAAIAHRLYFGDTGASWLVLAALGAMALFAMLMDYIATSVGAKKLGATWRGIVGAVAGGLVGLFFGLPGIVAGPFLGALLFEVLGGREVDQAAKAGAGAVLGIVGAAVIRVAICVVMVGLFIVDVLRRSLSEEPIETLLVCVRMSGAC